VVPHGFTVSRFSLQTIAGVGEGHQRRTATLWGQGGFRAGVEERTWSLLGQIHLFVTSTGVATDSMQG